MVVLSQRDGGRSQGEQRDEDDEEADSLIHAFFSAREYTRAAPEHQTAMGEHCL